MYELIGRTDTRVPSSPSHYLWRYRCGNCGQEFVAVKSAVTRGRKGCPTCKRPKGRTNWVDYTGQVVNGTVKINRQVGRTKGKLIVWSATCLYAPGGVVCGRDFELTSAAIRKGVFSCGCRAEEHNAHQSIRRIFEHEG